MSAPIDNDPRLLLITLWVQPRRVIQVLLSTAVLLLPRLLFFSAQPLPYYLPFNPGCPLIPIGGILFGPAGAWGALLASLLADSLTGMSTALSPFRAAGSFFFAFHAHLLWSRLAPRPGLPASAVQRAGRFLAAALPGGLADAAWAGFGSEGLRLYPFPYVAGMVLFQNLLFLPLIGIPLFVWIFARPQMAKALRDLETEYPTGWRLTRRGALGLGAGAFGALAAGLFVAHAVYRIGPFSAFIIGVTDCPWVTTAVTPFILLYLYAAFRKNSYDFAPPRAPLRTLKTKWITQRNIP